MAGLLDYVIGDDEKKDEYGQTQADRRMPIWSGMINAGLLALAGGQRMMPEERAQYIAKIGGSLAGIPQEMLAQKSELAKQALQRQQITASQQQVELNKQTLASGKFSLAQREAQRAYINSPGFQQSLAALPAHERALVIADLQSDKPNFDMIARMTDPKRGQGTIKDGYYQTPGSPWVYDMALEKWVHVGAPPTGTPPPTATPPPATPPPTTPPPTTPPPTQTPDVPRGPGGNVLLPPLVPGGSPYGGSTAPPPPPPTITAPPAAPPPVVPTAQTPIPIPAPQMSVAPPGVLPPPGASSGPAGGRQMHRPFPGATSPLDDGTGDPGVDPNVQLAQAQLQAQPFRNRPQMPSQVPGAPVAPPTPGAPVLTPQQTQLSTPPPPVPVVTPQDKADIHSVATEAQPPVVGATPDKPLFPGMKPEALQALTPARAELVRSIAEYRHKPFAEDTRVASAQGRINRQIMEQVRAYYPAYSQVRYQNMAPMLKEFSQAGKTGRDMTSLDIAAGHTATLDAAGEALKNGNSVDLNNIVQAARAKLGLPEGTSYQTVLNAVSGELTKAITGHVTETEIENWKKGMGWGASPAQIHGFTAAITHLMKEREEGFKFKYKNDIGTEMPYDMISPRNRERLNQIEARSSSKPSGGGSALDEELKKRGL